MEDWEFDLIDELYFVTSYAELVDKLPEYNDKLQEYLLKLLKKGWIKVFKKESDEEVLELELFNINYKKYNYLATKAGLLEHNSR